MYAFPTEDEGEDGEIVEKFVSHHRYERNHLLMQHIFSDIKVPNEYVPEEQSSVRLEGFQRQMDGLLEHKKIVDQEIVDIETAFQEKKRKMAEESAAFNWKIRKLSAKFTERHDLVLTNRLHARIKERWSEWVAQMKEEGLAAGNFTGVDAAGMPPFFCCGPLPGIARFPGAEPGETLAGGYTWTIEPTSGEPIATFVPPNIGRPMTKRQDSSSGFSDDGSAGGQDEGIDPGSVRSFTNNESEMETGMTPHYDGDDEASNSSKNCAKDANEEVQDEGLGNTPSSALPNTLEGLQIQDLLQAQEQRRNSNQSENLDDVLSFLDRI